MSFFSVCHMRLELDACGSSLKVSHEAFELTKKQLFHFLSVLRCLDQQMEKFAGKAITGGDKTSRLLANLFFSLHRKYWDEGVYVETGETQIISNNQCIFSLHTERNAIELGLALWGCFLACFDRYHVEAMFCSAARIRTCRWSANHCP